MAQAYTIRPFDGSDADVERAVIVLREAYRVLEPTFVQPTPDFEAAAWAPRMREAGTEWAVLQAPDGHVAGFAGWRLNAVQSHLHALFVAHADQRRGYGRALLHYHWAAALRRCPSIEVFTLHVREPALWARWLYVSEGYRYYAPGAEETYPALNVWIDACRARGVWPLPAPKLLMYRPAGGRAVISGG